MPALPAQSAVPIRGPKRASELLKPELQMVASHPVGGWWEPNWSLVEKRLVLLMVRPPLLLREWKDKVKQIALRLQYFKSPSYLQSPYPLFTSQVNSCMNMMLECFVDYDQHQLRFSP